jgi:type IV secretory pathway VirB2 component (pilin)
MNRASIWPKYCLICLSGVSATLFLPIWSWADSQAVLPWDQTLTIMQNFIAGSLAQSVLVISAVGAMLAFALAGDSELARRFAKTAIGTGAAVIAVWFLNYLLP